MTVTVLSLTDLTYYSKVCACTAIPSLPSEIHRALRFLVVKGGPSGFQSKAEEDTTGQDTPISSLLSLFPTLSFRTPSLFLSSKSLPVPFHHHFRHIFITEMLAAILAPRQNDYLDESHDGSDHIDAFAKLIKQLHFYVVACLAVFIWDTMVHLLFPSPLSILCRRYLDLTMDSVDVSSPHRSHSNMKYSTYGHRDSHSSKSATLSIVTSPSLSCAFSSLAPSRNPCRCTVANFTSFK